MNEWQHDPAPGVIDGRLTKAELLAHLLQYAVQLTPFELTVLVGDLIAGKAPSIKEADVLAALKPTPRASESSRDHGPRFN